MARTTLQIDDALIEAAMRLCGTSSKSATIELALSELIRHRERELLRRELGSFELNYDGDELQCLRRAD